MIPPVASIQANQVSPFGIHLPGASVLPSIHPTATVRNAQITGDVRIGPRAHIVNAVLRADEGTPFHIGAGANVQDFAVLHAHSTQQAGRSNPENLVQVPGKGAFAIYIGDGSSLAHGAVVHGPASIGDNTFVGFKATVDHARIGNHVEIGPHAYVKNVTVPDGMAVRSGAVVTNERELWASVVPRRGINEGIARINTELALAYHPNVSVMPPLAPL